MNVKISGRLGVLIMKKYAMSVARLNKELRIRIWGMFEPKDANEFVEEFKKTMCTIKGPEYVLAFDAKELNVSKPEMVPMLEGCFKMYKECNFKKVLIKVENNATLKMQLGRLARNVGLNLELV